jgi:hypothetical protein
MLSKAPAIDQLILTGTRVTEQGVKAFKAARPGANVYGGPIEAATTPD